MDELNLEVKTGEISLLCSLDDDDSAEFAIVVVSLSPRVNVISLSPRGDVVSSVTDCRVRRGLENNLKNVNVLEKLKKNVQIFEMGAMPFPCNGLLLCCVKIP